MKITDYITILTTVTTVAGSLISVYFALRLILYLREYIRAMALIDLYRVEIEQLKMYMNLIVKLLGLSDLTPFEIEREELFDMFKEREIKRTMLSKLKRIPPELINYFPTEKERAAFEKIWLHDKRNQLRQSIHELREYHHLLVQNAVKLDLIIQDEWKKAAHQIGACKPQ